MFSGKSSGKVKKRRAASTGDLDRVAADTSRSRQSSNPRRPKTTDDLTSTTLDPNFDLKRRDTDADTRQKAALADKAISKTRTIKNGRQKTSEIDKSRLKRLQNKAKARGIELDEVDNIFHPDTQAVVMSPVKNKGKSMARDPVVEANAKEFERRIGIAAFNDPRANGGAALMCSKIIPYINNVRLSAANPQELTDLTRSLVKRLSGGANFAGTVTAFKDTVDPEQLKAHLRELMTIIEDVANNGNLRERMSLIEQFTKMLGEDLEKAKKSADLKTFLDNVERAGMNRGAFEKSAEQGGKLVDEDVSTSLGDVPRDEIRIFSNLSPRTELTPYDLRFTPLSTREKKFQGEQEKANQGKDSSFIDQGYNTSLQFTEGERYFLVNEQNEWTEAMREQNYPLKAGPSGHTNLFFRANQLLGTEIHPDIMRLMVIGHMLPINAHSLIEIADIASKWGSDFKRGIDFYRNFAPYSEDEIRRLTGGKLPNEKGFPTKYDYSTAQDVWENYRSEDPLPKDKTAVREAEVRTKADKRLAEREKKNLQALKDLGVVTNATRPDSEIRKTLEAHLSDPRITPNMINALRRAEEHSSAEEVKARKEVEDRLQKLGFDLTKTPNLYDRIVTRLREAPLTINLKTNIIEDVMQAGGYLNQWERSFHPITGKQTFYGGGSYAIDRNETEKALHGLPELANVGEAAGYVTPEWEKRNKEAVKSLKQQIEELPGLKKDLVQAEQKLAAQEKELAVVLDEVVYSQYDNLKTEEIESRKKRYKDQYQIKVDLKKKRDELAKKVEQREGELDDLKFKLKKAELELAINKNTINVIPTDSQGFQENRTLGFERPHSAGLNVAYRAGSAPRSIYGTSHLVLKDSLKDRSTLTGGDSLEQIYKQKNHGMNVEEMVLHVGNFNNMGPALRKAQDGTLRILAEEALNPDAVRTHTSGDTQNQLYLEAQVFGPIAMNRDVQKVVIDEDDLDALETGTAVDYYNKPLPTITKVEYKKKMAQFAKANGIDIQYIRTGKSGVSGAFGGALRVPGEHITARRQAFEEKGEKSLLAFRSRNWAKGLAAVSDFRDKGSGSIFGTSYKTSGLTELAAQMEKLKKMVKDKKQPPLSEEELQKLAGETLEIYYNYPINPQYIDELERVFSNTMTALGQLVDRSLDSSTKTINREDSGPKPDNALLTKLRSEPRSPLAVTETRGDLATKQATISDSESQPKDGINLRYLYEDVDMYRILATKVEALETGNIIVLPPADDIIGEQLQARLREDQEQSEGAARTVLMPYNIGNYHWVGIAIEVDEGNSNVRVSYMDPLQSGGGSVPKNVRAEILSVYPEATITVANHLLQNDNSSCGPITIANLMNVVQGNIPQNDQILNYEQTRAIRQEHVETINNAFPDSNFAQRQMENQSTISTVFNMHQYLAQDATASFSAKEYSRILKVVDNISDLSEEPRNIINAAFASISENPTMDNAYYYRILRVAIYNAFREVQTTGNSTDRQHMDGLLQSLWGLKFDDVENASDFNDPDLYKFRDFEEMKAIGIQIDRRSEAEVQKLISEKTKELTELSATLSEVEKRKALIKALDEEIEKQTSSLKALSPLNLKKF